MNPVEVRFYPPGAAGGQAPGGQALRYVVIAARRDGQWMFCRHRERETWEIPGGHIEPGEGPDEAAARELAEETGALSFTLERVAVYGVFMRDLPRGESTRGGSTSSFGMLYYAEIHQAGPLRDDMEMAETMLSGALPGRLTYPAIQPALYERAQAYCGGRAREIRGF